MIRSISPVWKVRRNPRGIWIHDRRSLKFSCILLLCIQGSLQQYQFPGLIGQVAEGRNHSENVVSQPVHGHDLLRCHAFILRFLHDAVLGIENAVERLQSAFDDGGFQKFQKPAGAYRQIVGINDINDVREERPSQ